MRASLMTATQMRLQGVCGFLRHTPMSNQSGRRNAAPAGISRQEPDTPLAHRRPKYPLAGCFPAEPASVSSGNVISTQDSRECNHWTSEYASKNPSLRWSRSAICVRRTWSPTGIATFLSGSPGSGIMAHFLAGTDIGIQPGRRERVRCGQPC